MKQRGFSLIEIIVAFGIAAMAFTLLARLFSTSAQGARLATDYAEATLVAESALAQIASEAKLEDGSSNGQSEDRRYIWNANVTPYEVPQQATQAAQAIQANTLPLVEMKRVEVVASWEAAPGKQSSVRLVTYRTVQKQP